MMPSRHPRCWRCRVPLTVLGTDPPRESCVSCPPSGRERLAQRDHLTFAQAREKSFENIAVAVDSLFDQEDLPSYERLRRDGSHHDHPVNAGGGR